MIEYDRAARRLLQHRPFADDQRRAAERVRLDLELALNRSTVAELLRRRAG